MSLTMLRFWPMHFFELSTNTLLLINTGIDHLLFLVWVIWAAASFYRSIRRGENGISGGLLALFLALSITWAWSVAVVVLSLLGLSDDYADIMLMWRAQSMNLLIAAAGYLTYRIQKVRKDAKKEAEA